ncbi:hypothetical protein L1O03_11290 [Corynebacterium uropygiale]|uniref:Uncharacterized protein n=1 Tax=Corynebacterium uropygiale TaxID=1775911 RepID=A0A9X1QTW3_9CORY|nr:hypothetical protein [Corynebacterium uropygiale]MCF4007748.1 hypothetical protein [Corynebacterium uropygiale]
MKCSWSFYGQSQPRWMVALAWVLVFLLPVVTFLALHDEGGDQLLFLYPLIAGIVVLVMAFFLKSWLLIIEGLFTLTYYLSLGGLFMDLIP